MTNQTRQVLQPHPQIPATCLANKIRLIRHTSQLQPTNAKSAQCGDSEALPPFGPTLDQSEAARTNVHLQQSIQVPSAGCKGYWTCTDTALEVVIEQHCLGVSKLPPELALQQLCNTIQLFFSNPTETLKQDQQSRHQQSRHQQSHHQQSNQKPSTLRTLRKKHRHLHCEWRKRSGEPPEETASLRHEFHQTHKQIKRVTRQRSTIKNNRNFVKELAKFRKDPFKYGRTALGTKSTERPTFSAEVAEGFFPSRFEDSDRSHCYSYYSERPSPPKTTFTASTAPPIFVEFQEVLRSRRNASAPGPNGLPNSIWKRCPCLHTPLYNIIRQVWKSCRIPPDWQCAAVRLFHKSGPSDNPANFRPIALSNCEGRIFFALLGKVMLRHMTKNSFFDRRVQKGFLPGVAGCLEHSALLSDALRDARSNQRSICISWLDLRNAFRSVRHSLLLFALQHYGFPDHFVSMVCSYYDHLSVVMYQAILQRNHSTLHFVSLKAAHYLQLYSTLSCKSH